MRNSTKTRVFSESDETLMMSLLLKNGRSNRNYQDLGMVVPVAGPLPHPNMDNFSSWKPPWADDGRHLCAIANDVVFVDLFG